MTGAAAANFGAAVRARRAEAGITLDQLASASGVSIGTLSRVERGAMNTSLANAIAIANSLGTTVDVLSMPGQEVVVRRSIDAQMFTDARTGVVRTLIARPSIGAELIQYMLPPHARSPEFAPHGRGTKEILHVTSGAVEVHSGGDDAITLFPGDTAEMPADRDHQLVNSGEGAATIVILIMRPGN